MQSLPKLLMAAWLLPLAAFTVICICYSVPQFFGIRVKYSTQKYAAYLSIGAIVTGFVLSAIALFGCWLPKYPLAKAGDHSTHHSDEHTTPSDESRRTVITTTDGRVFDGKVVAENSETVTLETPNGEMAVKKADI